MFFIRGIGGIGKTQLALKYAEQAESRYQKRYFIDCHSKEKFEDSLRSLATQLEIDSIGKGTNLLISELVSKLTLTPNSLIVIDHVDNKDMFESMVALLPEMNNHVIITGCYNPNLPHIKDYPMEPFSPEESKELMKKLLSDYPALLADEMELENFVKQVPSFPLSIKQAVSLIRKLNGAMCLREYTDLYLKEDREDLKLILDTVEPDSDYTKTVAKTYLPSINEVAKAHPLARELLYLYAYFGGSGEFSAMFFENDAAYHLLMPKDTEVTKKTAARHVQVANNSLADFSLIDYRKNSRNEKVLKIHEILRKAVRLHTREKSKYYLEKAVELFNRGANELYVSANHDHVSALFREYVIQFSAFVEMAKKLDMEQQTIVDLLDHSPLSYKVPVEFGSQFIQNLKYVNVEDLKRFHDLQIFQRCKLIENDYEQLSSQQRAEFDSSLKSKSTSFTELLTELKQNLSDTPNLNLGIAYLLKGDINQAEILFKYLVDNGPLLTKVQALNHLHISALLKGDVQNHEYLDQAKLLLNEAKLLVEQGRYHGLSQREAAREGMFYGGLYTGGAVGVVVGITTTAVMTLGVFGMELFWNRLCDRPFRLENLIFSGLVGSGLGTAAGTAAGLVGGTVGGIDGMISFDPEKLAQIRDELKSKIKYLEDVLETNGNTKEPMKSKL